MNCNWSIANPDLGLIPANQPPPADIEDGMTKRNLVRQPSPVSTIRISLDGSWGATDSNEAHIISSDGAATTIDVNCQNGLTTSVLLHRK